MKKHLIYSINFLFALFIILTTNSCRKETSSIEYELNTKSLDLISEAKLHFDNNLKNAPSDRDLSGKEEKNKFQLLGKKALWEYAKVKKIKDGESVRVPIFYDEENFIKAGKDKKAMSLYNLSYLMMYKDKKGKMQTEWVITIPDDDYVDRKRNSGVKFTGVIHVLDWKGNLIKSYSYRKDGSVLMGKEMTFPKKNNLKVASQDEQIKLNDYWINSCYTSYLWDCSVDSSGSGIFCQEYAVRTCYNIRVVEPAGKELPISDGGGGGGPSDYTPDEPDCPVSGDPENPEPPLMGERSISTDSDDGCEETNPTVIKTDCNSFSFIKTSTANWQEAGLNNIRLKWVWLGGNYSGITREIYIDNVVFGLPTQYQNANGTITSLTSGEAATKAAIATEAAKLATYREFRDHPLMPDDAAVELFFRNKLQLLMASQRGTAGYTGSGSSNIRFNNEERSNYSDPYDCF